MDRAGVPFRVHRTGVFVILLCLAIGIRVGGWQLGLPAGVYCYSPAFYCTKPVTCLRRDYSGFPCANSV